MRTPAPPIRLLVMKIDPEISTLLEKIQKQIRSSARIAKDLAEAQKDSVQLQQTIDSIGELSYKDDARISLIPTVRIKHELCEKTIARLQEKIEADNVESIALLTQGGNLAAALLMPILDRRRETITASMRPFCRSDEMAVGMAQKADSYASAYGAIAGFSMRASHANRAGTGRIMEGLAQVEAVLKEALKGKSADLMQFLSEPPAAPTASAESETPAAVGAGETATPKTAEVAS